MVDELQDTSTMQGDIACHLAARHGNILVVGDDAQSIYSFTIKKSLSMCKMS
jgi:DNA helicase-2/ATP-dependent DNA helicase PcrA